MHLSAEQWTDLFRETPIPLALVRPDHRFAKCNSAYCQLVGFTEGQLLNRTWQSITHPDDVEGYQSGANQLAADPDADSYTIDKRYVTQRGYVIYVRINVTAIRTPDGQFAGYYVIAFPQPDHTDQQQPAVAKPLSIGQWIVRNPKDAIIVGLGAIVFLGKDTLVELIKLYLKP